MRNHELIKRPKAAELHTYTLTEGSTDSLFCGCRIGLVIVWVEGCGPGRLSRVGSGFFLKFGSESGFCFKVGFGPLFLKSGSGCFSRFGSGFFLTA